MTFVRNKTFPKKHAIRRQQLPTKPAHREVLQSICILLSLLCRLVGKRHFFALFTFLDGEVQVVLENRPLANAVHAGFLAWKKTARKQHRETTIHIYDIYVYIYIY